MAITTPQAGPPIQAPLKYTLASAFVVWKRLGCGAPVKFQLAAVPVIVSVPPTERFNPVMSTALRKVVAPPEDKVPGTLFNATNRLNVPPIASLTFSNDAQLRLPLLPALVPVRLYVAPLPESVSMLLLPITLVTSLRVPPIPVDVPAAPERLNVTGAA